MSFVLMYLLSQKRSDHCETLNKPLKTHCATGLTEFQSPSYCSSLRCNFQDIYDYSAANSPTVIPCSHLSLCCRLCVMLYIKVPQDRQKNDLQLLLLTDSNSLKKYVFEDQHLRLLHFCQYLISMFFIMNSYFSDRKLSGTHLVKSNYLHLKTEFSVLMHGICLTDSFKLGLKQSLFS